MANKRELKKEIKYVCGDLAAECLLAKNFVKGVDAKAMTEIITRIADLQISALNKVTFSFDKLPADFETGAAYRKARKEYFKKAFASLREKFYDKVNAIVKEMNAALPQEVKDNNKKA
ncbi:MAG: hypothetical protein K1V88_07135 [Muribaculaceae bacterium]|jgi:hypothetical protein